VLDARSISSTAEQGKREYPPFLSLFVTSTDGNEEVIMWRRCANGEAAHTHHHNLEEALRQAEFEFELMPGEWINAKDEFRSLKDYTRTEPT
jgi:hypothetical protein